MAPTYAQPQANELTLWANSPAHNRNDAFPLGNGRIATIVYGNPVNEEFQLNEETISKEAPGTNYNTETYKHLDALRHLIFTGRSDSAGVLTTTQVMANRCKGFGSAYQTAGSLHIQFADHPKYTDLKRSLSLDSALSVVSYRVGKTSFKEEAFTSFTDQLLIIRYTATNKHAINFDAMLNSPFLSEGREQGHSVAATENTITLSGITDDAAKDLAGKVRFMVRVKVVNNGGKISSPDGKRLRINGADEVIIYVAMATNVVNYRDISANPLQRIDAYMKQSTFLCSS